MKFSREKSAATAAATTPPSDSSASSLQLDGAGSLRDRLTRLREKTELANRDGAIAEAGIAVAAAERSHADHAVATHLVYLADRRLATAEAEMPDGLAMQRRPPRVEKRNRDDGLQQKIALSTWENEGGSAAGRSTSTSANRRCT